MERDFVSRANEVFARIAGWSFDNRWWVVGVSLLLLVGGGMLASRVQVDASYEAYFDPQDPVFLAYERFREDFGSDEMSIILYEAPGFEHGPWNVEVMGKIVSLTEALEDEVPFVYEVTTLANAELMVGEEDGIVIRPLRDDFPMSQADLLALRDKYLAKPMFVDGIISRDTLYGGILIEMDRSSTDPLEDIRLDPEGGDGLDNLYPQVTEVAIAEILARPEYEGITFYHSGDVPLNAAYNVIIGEESLLLGGATAALVALVLLYFFRSAVGVLAPTIVVQLSVVCSMAFIALLGWGLDLSFSAMPTLLTAIGVAHSVHILSEFRGLFLELGDRRAALVQTVRLVGAPCLLTSVTTAVGFASMSFVPIKSIAHMGIYSAFGVMMSFVLSLTLLMAMLSFGRKAPKGDVTEAQQRLAKGGRAVHALLSAILPFVLRQRVAILAVSALVFATAVVGISLVRVDANWLNDFSDRVEFKHSTLKIDQVMGGVTNLIVLLDSGEPEAVKEPAVLAEVERIQEWANQQPLVRKSYSIVDILKDLNQTFHADDPAHHRLPETRELVAQYLVLYESAGGAEADDYVSSDYQRARLELRIPVASTVETQYLVADLYDQLEASPLQATTLTLTGIGALWLKLMDYIVTSQIQGFLIAFSVIAVLLCVVFQSIRIGLVAMIPNFSPVILTLGVMGWVGIDLDYTKLMVGTVAMGIAVDDTIHLMSRFRHEFRETGSYEEALRRAFLDVGRALVITSVALVLGFLVLLASVLDSQATQGILLASTIVTALVADFLLLPALVLTLRPFGPEGARAERESEALPQAA